MGIGTFKMKPDNPCSKICSVLTFLFAWIIFVIILPVFTILIVIPVLCARLAVSIYLRKRNIKLCSPLDAVWAHEAPFSTSIVTTIFIVKGQADVTKIRKRLYDRVLQYDRFRCSLTFTFGFPCWQNDALQCRTDFNSHIKLISQIWTETLLLKAVANVQDVSLSDVENRPPWEILVIPKFIYSNGKIGNKYYAVVLRTHHALMDGLSIGNILRDAISDHPFQLSVDPIKPRSSISWLNYFAAFAMFPIILFRIFPSRQKNLILTGPKEICLSAPISLQNLKSHKKRTGMSVPDILLKCAGSALLKILDTKKSEMISAFVPVQHLPYPDRNPRNFFSFVRKPISDIENQINQSHNVICNFYIFYLFGLLPKRLARAFSSFVGGATIVFSNVPGPAEKLTVFGGDDLEDIGYCVPVKNWFGIGMALFSYGDRIRVSFISDRAALPESGSTRKLCTEFERHLKTLTEETKAKFVY